MAGKEGNRRTSTMDLMKVRREKISDAYQGHWSVREEEHWVTRTHNLLKEMLTVWRLLGGC